MDFVRYLVTQHVRQQDKRKRWEEGLACAAGLKGTDITQAEGHHCRTTTSTGGGNVMSDRWQGFPFWIKTKPTKQEFLFMQRTVTVTNWP
jgi:hypothetical protein